jgi:hypothetical protein
MITTSSTHHLRRGDLLELTSGLHVVDHVTPTTVTIRPPRFYERAWLVMKWALLRIRLGSRPPR